MKPITISFVTVIKNRTNIHIMHNNTTLNLKLFENNIKSLINLILPGDEWEFVIVDFNSTDVNMHEFIESLPKKDNLSFNIIKVDDEKFNKGKGLNIGLAASKYNITFCLDADMMVLTRNLFDDIDKYVINDNKILFPICWSYSNPLHTSGWKRDTGKGNVIQQKNTIIPYINNVKWGREDDHNFDYYNRNKLAVRTYYEKDFVHQWHPEYIKHMYYGEQKSA